LSGTGLHKALDASPRAERAPVPSRLSRWIAANAQVLGASAAVASARQGEHARVLATWPEGQTDSGLINHTAVALDDKTIVSRQPGQEIMVAIPVRLTGRPGAIGFRLKDDPETTDEALTARVRDAVLRRLEDDTPPSNAAYLKPLSPAARANVDDDVRALAARQGAALDVIATILDHEDLPRAGRALADALAARFACTRVSLGVRRFSKLKLVAVSGTASFDTRSAVMTAMTRAMRETLALGRSVSLPVHSSSDVPPPNHLALVDLVKTPAMLSVPLIDSGKTIGTLVLERDRPFSEGDVEQIAQLVVLSSPVFSLKKRDTSGPFERIALAARRAFCSIFGTSYPMAKLLLLAVLGVGIWSSQYHQALSISADAAIEASVQRAVVAGANSFISQVEKRAGDVVYQGDVLARLDVEDLQLERLKWASERDKLVKEQRATLAQRDRTRVRVLSAQRAQAQSQIDFLDAQIERAVLRAPIDGVVIAGDLSEALGSPVERGQLLFEVASLRDYRLILTVDESDIGDVGEGYRGKLKLRSLPHESFAFVVTRITPVSTPGDGANQFRLEANLENPPESLRPGMAGVARIDAGERPIGVIWTRNFVRWARIKLWRVGLL
jgi:multidrug resistance efflux pump